MPDWLRPATLDEALDVRSDLGDDCTLVAGGTFLMILRRAGLFHAQTYLELRSVGGLDSMTIVDGELRIGTLVTHRQIEHSPLVREGWPLLASAFGQVASPRIRNQATVGGVLADADYASDPPAALVVADARVRLVSKTGSREVPVESLIVGHYDTVIGADEVLVEVIVPPSPARTAYHKFRTRSSEDRPCVGVAVAMRLSADRVMEDLRVVVGAVSDRPRLLPEVCAAARGRVVDRDLATEVADAYADGINHLSDLRGSSEYRRQATRVLVRRAVEGVAA